MLQIFLRVVFLGHFDTNDPNFWDCKATICHDQHLFFYFTETLLNWSCVVQNPSRLLHFLFQVVFYGFIFFRCKCVHLSAKKIRKSHCKQSPYKALWAKWKNNGNRIGGFTGTYNWYYIWVIFHHFSFHKVGGSPNNTGLVLPTKYVQRMKVVPNVYQ